MANSKGGEKSDVHGNSWKGVICEGKWDGFGLEREKNYSAPEATRAFKLCKKYLSKSGIIKYATRV